MDSRSRIHCRITGFISGTVASCSGGIVRIARYLITQRPNSTQIVQKLPQSVRIIDGAAFCAAGAKKRSAGIGDEAAAAADFDL